MTVELLEAVKIFSQSIDPKLSGLIEKAINASDANNAKRASETMTGVSFELVEENIRVKLEPLNAQITTLTQLLTQLYQVNSDKTTPTAGPRIHSSQAEPPLIRETGPFRALPGTDIGVTGLSPDKGGFYGVTIENSWNEESITITKNWLHIVYETCMENFIESYKVF